jgi:predicted nucleotide-binding protein (sugar kinase/HSP70/actin superfamily)
MPIIRIDYDNEQIRNEEVIRLSHAVREIVSEVTNIEDVFVYANSSEIKIKVAPVEIFIEMSSHKIKDLDELMENIKRPVQEWKKVNDFKIPVNLSIIPMPWKIEIGI